MVRRSRAKRLTDSVGGGRAVVLAVAGVCLLAAGCGTRLSSTQAAREIRSAYGQGAGTQSGGSAGAGGSSGFSSSSGPGGGAGTAGTGLGSPVSTDSGSGGAGSASGASSGPSTGSAGSAPGKNGAGFSAIGKAGNASAGSGTPIVVGMDCNCSGLIGALLAPARDAYMAWVQEINAKGGIDGHPIKVFYADDNGSGSQDLQNVKQFVESDHVIALVNLVTTTGALDSVAQYAQQKGIPIVGGTGTGPRWQEDPALFSAVTSSQAWNYAWAAEMKNAGKTVVGAIYCAEDQECALEEQAWKAAAVQLGLNVKLESKESIANPSFSADCLRAQSDGIQALVPMMDGASVSRVARDCSQQGYHPLIVDPDPYANPPSYMNGAVATLVSFPWFLTSGSPALTEYGQAIARYVHNPLNAWTSLGWVNAKLFEAALTGHVSATPSPRDVFTGLYALNGSTLGGLTAPLHYSPGPHPAIKCSFRAVVANGNWAAPSGLTPEDCEP